MMDDPVEARREFSALCFAEAAEAEARWIKQALAEKPVKKPGWVYHRAWRNVNRDAKIDI